MTDRVFSILFLVVLPIVILVWFGALGGVRLSRIARTARTVDDHLQGYSTLIRFLKSQTAGGAHPQSQYIAVIEGSLLYTDGTEEHKLGPGEFIYTPPDIPHRVTALEDTLIVSVWVSPPGVSMDAVGREISNAVRLPLVTLPDA